MLLGGGGGDARYPREGPTGELLRELRAGRLDLVLAFCAAPDDALERERLRDEPVVVHLAASHPLAARERLALTDLRDETLLVAGGPESPGYSAAVLECCRTAGFEPRTRPDPYPDLGLQAVREGLGIVLYVRTTFGPDLDGSAFVPVEPPQSTLPFDLLWRRGMRTGALDAVLAVASELREREDWTA